MKTTQSKNKRATGDLAESKRDKELLKPDEATLDLPDVKDIPGQEHVRPLPAGEMADTTISSADEEANELLDTDEDILTDKNLDVTTSERDLLQRSSESMATLDDEQLNNSDLDKTDDEGEMLNERSDRSGKDLDVPGSEDDDANEKIGEEDEENNSYSLRDPEDE
ncbi:MAG TPA: hypothetical protein VHQ93_06280 [Chitinophagaceae bacterium]|jgi:hypothetical protein|nr:hypothetical protein [Chitinophagaceae bacterium]